ncbi:MAG: hypothetical protein K2X27_10030 [Candidatus Obscuribacterales bacterium]|nr:hypothetical protein [Candidatus Obscuribacterales bacterium]
MMKRRIRQVQGRVASGQGIIEGVVGTWLVVTVGIAVLLLMLNVGIAVMNQEKLNLVATAAASHISQGTYFLGMERLDANGSNESFQAKRVAEAEVLTDLMLDKLNLPHHNKDSFQVDFANDQKLGETTDSGEATIITVKFSVGGLKTIGSFFAPFGLEALGISTESAVPPPGTLTLHFHDPKPKSNGDAAALRNVRIPMYFCGIQPNDSIANADDTRTAYPVCPKGKFVGNPIHAIMSPWATCDRDQPQHPSIGYESGQSILPYWGYGFDGNGSTSP